MADNIAVTPGTGASVAADDIGGVLYQRIKLTLGADGVATDVAPGRADETAGVPVTLSDQDLAAVQAPATLIGEVQESPTANTLLDRMKVLHADLTDVIALLPASLGTKAASASLATTLSTENTAQLEAIMNSVGDTGTVNVAQDTAAIMNGATALTPKFAAISSTDDGDTVALVSGKKIRVLSMYFVVAGATTVKFQSGASTDKTGAMSFAANGGISLPFNPVGWFETTAGEKLNHVLSNAVAIAGGLTYIEV